MALAHEVNFDGLVGPTHNYAGLALGNLASQAHGGQASNPRAAALEGLAKMKLLMDLGIEQSVLPPHPRPDIATLRRLGFTGSDADVLAHAVRESPALLAACCSASSMWAANAATVSPAADCADGRLHVTVANLVSNFHRSLEPPVTLAILRRIFADDSAFAVHLPLPSCERFADEGAANHTRLTASHDQPGIELFVYSRNGKDTPEPRLPARQSLDASAAIARNHQLDGARTIFARQHPSAVDAGVFHNDVIAVGHAHVLLCHERAWVDQAAVLTTLQRQFREACSNDLVIIQISEDRLPLQLAVATYLFNSQLLTFSGGRMGLLCPTECRDEPRVADLLAELTSGTTPLQWVCYIDVRQSMSNGGGPACLRLRVALTDTQRRLAHPGVFLTPASYDQLVNCISRRYRDHLTSADLADPHLLTESRDALDEITRILQLGSIYDFQLATGDPCRSHQ